MQSFPAFFPLDGRIVVIAGDGEAAMAKARLFDGSPATVRRLTGQAARDPAAFAGASLIFIAGSDEADLQAMLAAARSAGAPVNVVDHPDLCDFHTPAIVDRGPVVAAIGTSGAAPVLAGLLRAEIETRLPRSVGDLASLLARRRGAIRAAYPDIVRRRGLFRRVLASGAGAAVEAGDLQLAGRLIDEVMADTEWRDGRVDVIEAPVEADRLSLRAVRALGAADVVVVGDGAGEIVGRHARRDAERWESRAPQDLARAALRGLRLALVERSPDPGLVALLRAAGVAAELLAPAP